MIARTVVVVRLIPLAYLAHISLSLAQTTPEPLQIAEVRQAWKERESRWSTSDVVTQCDFEAKSWGFVHEADSEARRIVVIKRRGDQYLFWYPVEGRVTVQSPAMSFTVHESRTEAGGQRLGPHLNVKEAMDLPPSAVWILESVSESAAAGNLNAEYEALDYRWQFQRLAEDYWRNKTVSPSGNPLPGTPNLVRFEFSNDSPGDSVFGHVVVDREHGFRVVEISETATSDNGVDSRTDLLRLRYLNDTDTETHVAFDWRQEGKSNTLGNRGHSFVGEIWRRKVVLPAEEFRLSHYGIIMRDSQTVGGLTWVSWVAGACLIASVLFVLIARALRK